MAGFSGGQIVIADWRDALPKEPNKLRPAVVVEDSSRLFRHVNACGQLVDQAVDQHIRVIAINDVDAGSFVAAVAIGFAGGLLAYHVLRDED